MRHFTVETPVQGTFSEVFARMNRHVFDALTPAGVSVQLARYDGEQPGDEIVVLLRFPLLPVQRWHTQIVAREELASEAFFTDASVAGSSLPFFLTAWQHRHRVVADGPTRCRIRDEVTFSGPGWIPGGLLQAVLWLQFAARRPRYQAIFGK